MTYKGLSVENSKTLNVAYADTSAPTLDFINITNEDGNILNLTEIIEPDQDVTIYVNVSSASPLENVWIVIWDSIASAGDILWQGFQ